MKDDIYQYILANKEKYAEKMIIIDQA